MPWRQNFALTGGRVGLRGCGIGITYLQHPHPLCPTHTNMCCGGWPCLRSTPTAQIGERVFRDWCSIHATPISKNQQQARRLGGSQPYMRATVHACNPTNRLGRKGLSPFHISASPHNLLLPRYARGIPVVRFVLERLNHKTTLKCYRMGGGIPQGVYHHPYLGRTI